MHTHTNTYIYIHTHIYITEAHALPKSDSHKQPERCKITIKTHQLGERIDAGTTTQEKKKT